MAEVSGIKRSSSFSPEGALVALRGVAEDANGLREGFRFKKQFIAVWRTADNANGFVASYRHLSSFLAGKVEDADAILHIFHVRDEDGVSNNEPIADGGVGFLDDVYPLVLPVLPKADFDDAAIWRISICDRQNPVVHKPQPEHVVDAAEYQLWA